MWFNELPEHWLTRFQSARDSRSRPPRAGARLLLERLEDRLLPSNYTAASVSDLIADINAANKAGGTNTVNLAANTTFDLTAVDNTTNGANGLPVISGGGKKAAADNLTIVGNGDTIERSTASGTPAFRLLDVASGSSLTLADLTLQGGCSFGSGAAADGGAIYNQGTLTLSGATVQGNTAQGSNGAAAGALKNNRNQFSAAQPGADAAGGGIWSSGSLTLQGGSTVQNNTAQGGRGGFAGYQRDSNGGAGGGGFGGALYEAGGSVTLNSVMLTGNQALGGVGGQAPFGGGISGNGGVGSGGGLYVASGTLVMNNATVRTNGAQGGAGGIFSGGSHALGGSGGAGSGGGLYVGGGTVTLQAVELLSDSARGGDGGEYNFTEGVTIGAIGGDRGLGGNGLGGGLYVGGGAVTLTGDTVTGNATDAGGSGFLGVPTGSPGVGEGGGVYILSTASVCLDTATLNAIVNNNASTSNPNIAGSYSMC